MLSVAKLKAPRRAYYCDALATGLEDYYLGVGEAPGHWVGQGAEILGLAGRVVDVEGFDAILAGRDPATGTRLVDHSVKVLGYDATFCAPKSVSVLYGLAPPAVAAEVRAAHDSAVRAALAVYEDVACRGRRGHAGQTVVEADGFVGAAFHHQTSRSSDPHLHTHVVLAYPVRHGGRWSALDGRRCFPWAKPCGHLYEAQLRAELTRRLGVEWGPVRNGIADIAAVPKPVLEAFSKRRAEIEEHLRAVGRSSARAAQLAAYATRQPKDHHRRPDELRADWWRQAAELGVTQAGVAGWTGRGRTVERPHAEDPAVQRLFAHLAGSDGLTARRSTFDRRAVVRAVADAFGAGGDAADLVRLADDFLASDEVVALPIPDDCGDVLLRRDGSVVPLEADGARFSTRDLLAVEDDLLAGARARQTAGVGMVPTDILRRSLAGKPSLGTEQRALVSEVCRSGRGVDVVVGAAGTGKTAALGTAREAWEAAGHEVIGCALAARAAAQLTSGAGIRASTIHRLLAATAGERLPERSVLVVDEGGMVGTRQLARLLDLAADSGAKVVLVGDHRQLPEVAAGGAFAALAEDLGAITLRRNRRQIERWEREALAALRDGDPQRAVDAYVAAGRVTAGDDAPTLHAAMVDDWWEGSVLGEELLMLASHNSQVEALNRLARRRMRAEGQLGSKELVAGGRGFAVGDVVLATYNDYRLGLLNGTRGVVSAIDVQRGSLRISTDEGRSVDVHARYLRLGRLRHGYASTVHKAQGATVDATLVLADDQSVREAIYTGLSRGRAANRVYVMSDDNAEAREAHLPDPLVQDELAALRSAVNRSGAQELATPRRRPARRR
ncbi:MAG TPA: MobF family relaxase [Acidimicrobiales bacterium]|nr:MobF family relaxase [Acidimicrobiales bacterium]